MRSCSARAASQLRGTSSTLTSIKPAWCPKPDRVPKQERRQQTSLRVRPPRTRHWLRSTHSSALAPHPRRAAHHGTVCSSRVGPLNAAGQGVGNWRYQRPPDSVGRIEPFDNLHVGPLPFRPSRFRGSRPCSVASVVASGLSPGALAATITGDARSRSPPRPRATLGRARHAHLLSQILMFWWQSSVTVVADNLSRRGDL